MLTTEQNNQEAIITYQECPPDSMQKTIKHVVATRLWGKYDNENVTFFCWVYDNDFLCKESLLDWAGKMEGTVRGRGRGGKKSSMGELWK